MENKLQERLFNQLRQRELFQLSFDHGMEYLESLANRPAFPSKESLEQLKLFDEDLGEEGSSTIDIIRQLKEYGEPATVSHQGGRYFGFVTGGVIPVTSIVQKMTNAWDQCGGLYLTSPINAQLEKICEDWLKSIFRFPETTVAGFVSGTSMANLCALAAARHHIYDKVGWDVNKKGLRGAPPIRIILHDQVHACIYKSLALLGLGTDEVETLPCDYQGRLLVDTLPDLDETCIVICQAGNVNTGAFDDFTSICSKANAAGAWVHVDGAFGLWAAASSSLKHLTKDVNLADSWAIDGHKTLNTPYDSGIVFCKDEQALGLALQANGNYIQYSKDRDPMQYTPEMSKRSRAIEIWTTMKGLGRSGIDELICLFHQRAQELAKGINELGFRILNDVVFNQILVAAENDAQTEALLKHLQTSQEMWCGGSSWKTQKVIRLSVCSWQTTEKDLELVLRIFKQFQSHS